MPRQPVSFKRIARARPPKVYIPNSSTPKPDLSKQFMAKEKTPWTPRTKPTNQEIIYQRHQAALQSDNKPHFKIGGKQVYFPHAKIVLLRPSAKHTPFQAKFIVPRNFNKLDLRDYLWNVYKLRALNVTTQLLWGKWERESPGRPRYRKPQIKKMTIEMEQPFIWPKPTPEPVKRKQFRVELADELRKYAEDVDRIGSDKLRPPKAFGGIVGPYVPAPEPFVPKRISRQMANRKKDAEKMAKKQTNLEKVRRFLNL